MITYNHEDYIGEAIESVIQQEVDFPYELVIGEDCSTDNTLAICQEYQKKYPEIIRLLHHESNLGMSQNFLSTFIECKGEYLAILEGDDFWSSPKKLQQQVDFLSANSDYAIVFTGTLAFFEDQDLPGYQIPHSDCKNFSLEKLLQNNFIATCSVMYRKKLISEIPDYFKQLDMLDWPLNILYAEKGKIGFIDETMANYRRHSNSNYSSNNVVQNFFGIIKFYRIINRHLRFIYRKLIYNRQSIIFLAIARTYKKDGDLVCFVYYLLFALRFKLLAKIVN